MANIINSKNESKSQLITNTTPCLPGCGKYHKFKERKQITTAWDLFFHFISCGKYHKFKERKQITTERQSEWWPLWLWQIS
ncbi:MAG: hypothetical protein IPM42_20670 [Saprospiraceae bacterium]|nr:hypothetical protein [Saprospiraceae bacterium]